MKLRIDASDGEPVFVQIVRQIRAQIAAGRLPPGHELPPIRELAARLVLNPSTIVKAYAQLETDGVIVKRSTAGTFVAPDGPVRALPLARADLSRRADRLLDDARRLGLTLDELLSLLRDRHVQLETHHV